MGNQFSITDQERSFGEDNSTQKEDDEEAMCIVPTRVNLFFPNEVYFNFISIFFYSQGVLICWSEPLDLGKNCFVFVNT